MALIFLFLILILSVGLYFRIKNKRKRELISKIPSLSSLPILDHALHFISTPSEDILEFLFDLSKDLGNAFYVSLFGNMQQVFTSDPRISEQILSSAKFVEKTPLYDFFKNWLKGGLFVSKSHEWHQNRKLFNPFFHIKNLDQQLAILDKHGEVFVDQLVKTQGRKVDVFYRASVFTLDVICEIIAGHKLNEQLIGDSEYCKAVDELTILISKRIFHPIFHYDFVYRFSKAYKRELELTAYTHKFTDDVIRKRKEHLITKAGAEDEKTSAVFLDLLLQSEKDGQPWNDNDIRGAITEFIIAGHDTITSAIAFTLLNIATYPDVQQNVLEECQGILNGRKLATMDDLKQMKYLKNVIRESLRLYPSAPLISRLVPEEIQLGDHVLPAGVGIAISPFIMGRDESNFENPFEFDPNRFNEELKNNFAFIPFSAGPRNCIGQKLAILEMKILLSKIVRKFEILIRDEDKNPKLKYEVVLRSVNGINLIFKERN